MNDLVVNIQTVRDFFEDYRHEYWSAEMDVVGDVPNVWLYFADTHIAPLNVPIDPILSGDKAEFERIAREHARREYERLARYHEDAAKSYRRLLSDSHADTTIRR